MLKLYIGIGYILPTIGGYVSIGRCRVAEYVLKKKDAHFSKSTICNPAPEGRTNTP